MKALGVSLLALIAAVPLQAQAPASPSASAGTAPINPAAEAAARELLEAMEYRKTAANDVANTLASMRSGQFLSRVVDSSPAVRMQRSKNPAAWDAALKRLGARQAELAQAPLNDLIIVGEDKRIKSYAAHFSVSDLKELTQFYKSPLGKRVTATMPAVNAESQSFTQTELAKRLGLVLQQIQPDMQRELKPLLPQPAAAPK